jgi:hypothetical protein
VVLVTSESKIDLEIDPERCHFIFDKEETWEHFRKSYPVAFLIGCKHESVEIVREKLKGAGFKLEVYAPTQEFPAVLATNKVFRQRIIENK